MMFRNLVAMLIACATSTGVLTAEPKGNRILGIAVNEVPDAGYNSSFGAARAVGLQAVELSLNWDEIELEPGVYRPDPNWLEIASSVYPAYDTKVALVIKPIDTKADRRPQWLKAKRWDDPAVTKAYVALINWVMVHAKRLDLVSLALGNEVDVLLGESADDWNAYTTFAAATAKAIKTDHPKLLIGSKTTFAALSGPRSKNAQALHQKMDVALLTYYPLDDDFKVRPTTAVADDFAYAVKFLRDKPLHFTEIGYPSSSECGSSPMGQEEFVRQAFAAWDKHAEQIGFMNFVWLNDIADAELDGYLKYYGVNTPCFVQFLATLGLRHDGIDKPAFKALAEEAHKRGW